MSGCLPADGTGSPSGRQRRTARCSDGKDNRLRVRLAAVDRRLDVARPGHGLDGLRLGTDVRQAASSVCDDVSTYVHLDL